MSGHIEGIEDWPPGFKRAPQPLITWALPMALGSYCPMPCTTALLPRYESGERVLTQQRPNWCASDIGLGPCPGHIVLEPSHVSPASIAASGESIPGAADSQAFIAPPPSGETMPRGDTSSWQAALGRLHTGPSAMPAHRA
jgi:hypothetical protein